MKAIVSIKKGLAMVLAAALAIGSLSMPADVANAAGEASTASVTAQAVSMKVGDSQELTVTGDNGVTSGNGQEATIHWETDDSETVSVTPQDGNLKKATITAKKAGNAVITAKKGQAEIAKWNVTVSAASETGTTISLSQTAINLTPGGEAVELTATVEPAGQAVTWGVTGNDKVIVSPDSAGSNKAKVSAQPGATGTATITASVDGATATCTATITAQGGSTVPVTGVSLDKSTLTLEVEKFANLKVTIEPANASNRAVTWSSSNPAVATVDATTGRIEGKAVGTAIITATTADGNKTATCTVTVVAKGTLVPVGGVSLNKTTLSLAAGASETLTATVTPGDATDKTLDWKSSNEAVATVDGTGKVTAVAEGTAIITVTTNDGDKTATCTVTVTAAGTTNVAVTGVSLSAKTLVIGKNATKSLKATVAPENATNKNVTWASNNRAIATVDARGNVKGIKKGTATITATTADGAKKATCAVTVTEVTLNKTALTLEFGQINTTLKATMSNAKVDSLVSWKTSNATVVKVDARTGKLTALNKAGWANITVTTKAGATAVCKVTVKAPAVKDVTLGVKKLTMGVKESYKLNATVNPANVANKKVNWTSDKPKIVKVKNGKLTALKAGKAKITVTSQADKSKKATITVTVKKTPDKKAKVTLNKKKINLKVKKTFQIKAKISSKYGCASFKYTVDKKGKKVVKVDKNGKVTAKKKGKATITVKPYNGKGKSAKLQITVK